MESVATFCPQLFLLHVQVSTGPNPNSYASSIVLPPRQSCIHHITMHLAGFQWFRSGSIDEFGLRVGCRLTIKLADDKFKMLLGWNVASKQVDCSCIDGSTLGESSGFGDSGSIAPTTGPEYRLVIGHTTRRFNES